jgi:hypothetical protein
MPIWSRYYDIGRGRISSCPNWNLLAREAAFGAPEVCSRKQTLMVSGEQDKISLGSRISIA